VAQDKVPPAGLHPRVAKLLLDKLETDSAFRNAFVNSPDEALRSIGHTEGAECLALKPGATLASPEQIRASREKLEQSLTGIQNATCPLDAQEGM
jgi:putative modified peptide